MYGKLLKINDFNFTYGQEEKKIFVFLCFKDTKYNTQYVIFADNLADNKLYYGSAYVRNNILVIMEVENDISDKIRNITTNYINNINTGEIQILSMENIEKVEWISSNHIEVRPESLVRLDSISIPKPKVKEKKKDNEKKEKKKTLLICLSVFLIFLIVFAFINKEHLIKHGKIIHCESDYQHTILSATVHEEKDFKYNLFGDIYEVSTISEYLFFDKDEFNEFYDNGIYFEYIETDQGDYSFDKERMLYRMNEKIVDFTTYDKPVKKEEIKGYYEEYGYVCTEGR